MKQVPTWGTFSFQSLQRFHTSGPSRLNKAINSERDTNSEAMIPNSTTDRTGCGKCRGGWGLGPFTDTSNQRPVSLTYLLLLLLLGILHAPHAHLPPSSLHAHRVSVRRWRRVALSRRESPAPWLLTGRVGVACHAVQLGALHRHEVHLQRGNKRRKIQKNCIFDILARLLFFVFGECRQPVGRNKAIFTSGC